MDWHQHTSFIPRSHRLPSRPPPPPPFFLRSPHHPLRSLVLFLIPTLTLTHTYHYTCLTYLSVSQPRQPRRPSLGTHVELGFLIAVPAVAACYSSPPPSSSPCCFVQIPTPSSQRLASVVLHTNRPSEPRSQQPQHLVEVPLSALASSCSNEFKSRRCLAHPPLVLLFSSSH